MKQLSERGEKIVSYPQHYPAGPRYFQVRLTKHTGMLLMFSTRSYTITGTLEQCEAAYRDAQTHNLAMRLVEFSVHPPHELDRHLRKHGANQPDSAFGSTAAGIPGLSTGRVSPAALPPISADVLIRSQCPARPILRTVRANRPTPAAGPGKG